MTHVSKTDLLTTVDRKWLLEFFAPEGRAKALDLAIRAEQWMCGPVADISPNVSTIPTIPGTPFGGGFFAGLIVIGGLTYALVVAPKECGEATDIRWKVEYSKSTGADSVCDGFANSEALNNSQHPAAQFCRGLDIDGFTDWYLPSRDELEICYRNLKPGSTKNHTYESRIKVWGAGNGYNGVDEHGNGHNASSLPIGAAYTKDTPQPVVSELFEGGGEQAFDERWYWSSTEFLPVYAWFQHFAGGGQDAYGKSGRYRCRAVRKFLI